MAGSRLSLFLVPLVILSFIVATSQSRYHYQQQDELPSTSYNYNQNLRSHYHGSDLSTLSMDELETLLFLLEKAKAGNDATTAGRYYEKPIPLNLDSASAKNYYYETRNKRTGHPQKKAIDWEDYFGIDKKKRSPVPIRTLVKHPDAATGTVHKSPSSHSHDAVVASTHAPVTTAAPAEHEHHTKSEAEHEKEEEQVQDFFKNMAFATNMRRKKRDVSSTIAMQKVSAAIIAPQVLIPKVMEPTTTAVPVPPVKDAPANPEIVEKVAQPQAGDSITAKKLATTESNEIAPKLQATSNSEMESVFLTTPTTVSTTKAPTTRLTTAAAPVEMSRGDLEKLKAKLIKQINAAYSIEQLRQVLRDGSAAN